jgi:hypothetical protein
MQRRKREPGREERMSTAERHKLAHPDVAGLAGRVSGRLRGLEFDVGALERRWMRGRTVRVPYRACRDLPEVMRALAELAPRTVIVDVEPLIADWNTGRRVLDVGVSDFLDVLAIDPGRVQSLVFATNSRRRPSALPAGDGPFVRYISHAGKPLRTDPYRGVVRPGVVVGDQVATDGFLAWRLGLTFVHYIPEDVEPPPGPRAMRAVGRPLRPLLFRTS